MITERVFYAFLKTVLLLISISIFTGQGVVFADWRKPILAPEVPTPDDLLNQDDSVDETVDSIDRNIEKWKRFVTKASDFETGVAEISTTYANYLKTLTKLDASCRVMVRKAAENRSSSFAQLYRTVARKCKSNVNRHKELGRQYAKDITKLTALALETNEAVGIALDYIPSLYDRRRAAELRDQLNRDIIGIRGKWDNMQKDLP